MIDNESCISRRYGDMASWKESAFTLNNYLYTSPGVLDPFTPWELEKKQEREAKVGREILRFEAVFHGAQQSNL